MRFFIRLTALLSLMALAACDNSGRDAANGQSDLTPEQELAALEARTTLTSGFATPNASGKFPSTLSTLFQGSYTDNTGNGYAIVLGRNDAQIRAHVGLLPGTTGGDLPRSGTASMSGRYHVAEIGKSLGEDRDYAEPHFTIGQITLRANFEHGILSGSDGALSVDGSFASSTLTGGVTFNGRAGILRGKIGEDRAVGAFHGTDSSTAMVGGFMVTR